MVRQVKGAIRSGNEAVSGATLEVGLPNGWVVGFYTGEDPAFYFPQKTRSIFCWESIRTTFLALNLSVSRYRDVKWLLGHEGAFLLGSSVQEIQEARVVARE